MCTIYAAELSITASNPTSVDVDNGCWPHDRSELIVAFAVDETTYPYPDTWPLTGNPPRLECRTTWGRGRGMICLTFV